MLSGLRRQLQADGTYFGDISEELCELDNYDNLNAADLETIPEEMESSEVEATAPPEEPDVPEDEHGEEVPDRETQAQLLRVHKNLGHPRAQEFVRALGLGGCRPGIRRWVRQHFRCAECDSQFRRQGVRRPATLPRSYVFNRVVGIDTTEIETWNRAGLEAWLVCICWGVKYGQAGKSGADLKPTSLAAWRALVRSWFRHYGLLADLLAEAGVFQHVTDACAPWQNGITERYNGLLKRQVILAHETFEPEGAEELETPVHQCIASRNRFADRSGFSPSQRVFGHSLRLLRSITGDDLISPDVLADAECSDFQRAREMRIAATAALFRLDAKTKLMKAERARTRTRHGFNCRDWVFLRRRNRMNQRWRAGPGVVIMLRGATAWMPVMQGTAHEGLH